MKSIRSDSATLFSKWKQKLMLSANHHIPVKILTFSTQWKYIMLFVQWLQGCLTDVMPTKQKKLITKNNAFLNNIFVSQRSLYTEFLCSFNFNSIVVVLEDLTGITNSSSTIEGKFLEEYNISEQHICLQYLSKFDKSHLYHLYINICMFIPWTEF